MIEPTRQNGREMALLTCDFCGDETRLPAMHGNGIGKGKGKTLTLPPLLHEGKVIQQAQKSGWTLISGKLRCPSCEAARKSSKEKPDMANVEPIRQPTPEQRRQIFEMLTACYDLTAKRYSGKETDVTIAEAIGGGCMFGWVAEIREAMFGPDGGNEEHEALMADLVQWRANADKLAEEMASSLREFNDARTKVKDLQARLDAVVKAAGPKVRTA